VAGPRVRTANGTEIQRGADGRVREIHTPGGGLILHSPSGVRRVELTRPDGRIVVAIGHGGYIQRPMAFNGHPFIQRTYMVNGIATPRVYRSWAFGGRQYAIYQPLHFFRPEFYVWAFNPWPRAATYRWGWEAQPWSGYYAGYYTPYPSYAGPAFWLTDYVVSTTLAEAYQTHAGAPPVSYGPPAAMPDDARFAITREVQRELGQERVDQSMAGIYGPGAALPPPPLFTPNGPRTFLVAGDVPAYAGDVEVPLAEGAVLQLAATPAPGSEYAEVQVLASRGSACPRGSFVYVSTVDLQEMQNHMQATIDQGLEQMQPGHGMPGIPTPPPQTAGEADALYANAVQPDAAANDDINLAVREADQSEQGLGAL
jgi:hypothetical protein